MLYLLTFLVGFSHADLEFDETELVMRPEMGDTESSGAFRFVNVAETPVTITEVKTSCGCTTAALSKHTYQTGETGVIFATFKFEERQGKKSKKIHVTTRGSSEPIILTVTAYIPEILEIRPTMVWWKRGEEISSKTVTVKVKSTTPAALEQIAFSAEGFESTIKVVHPGREYEVIVTPHRTSNPVVASMAIKTDLPERGSFRSYAMIR